MREGLRPMSARAHRRIARAYERPERNLRGEQSPSFRHSELRMTMFEVTRLSLCALRLDFDVDRDCLADSGD